MDKKPPKKKLEPQPKSPAVEGTADLQRLQRAMAAAGFGSRRECEEFIETGRVEVDGAVVTKLGTKVNPFTQKIFVDGQRLTLDRREYFVLNKPPGIVSTSKDPSGRPRVIDLIKTEHRVYNVGRLDQSSEGLILVTNDGDLANLLTHPRYGVAKKYLVQVHGVPTAEKLKSLSEGVYLADGKARVSNIKFKKRAKDTSWLEIVLEEGRNREIRRLLARVGHKVLRLRRIAIGPLKLGDLPIGAHRALSHQEVRDLRRAITKKPVRRKRGKKKSAGEDGARPKQSRSPAQSSRISDKQKTAQPKSAKGKSTRLKTKGRASARITSASKKSAKKKAAGKRGMGSEHRATGNKKHRGTKKRGR